MRGTDDASTPAAAEPCQAGPLGDHERDRIHDRWVAMDELGRTFRAWTEWLIFFVSRGQKNPPLHERSIDEQWVSYLRCDWPGVTEGK